MPAVGVEPTRACAHRILSPARLPVPPRRLPCSGRALACNIMLSLQNLFVLSLQPIGRIRRGGKVAATSVHLYKIPYRTVICPLICFIKKTCWKLIVFSVIMKTITAFIFSLAWFIGAVTKGFIFFYLTFHKNSSLVFLTSYLLCYQ